MTTFTAHLIEDHTFYSTNDWDGRIESVVAHEGETVQLIDGDGETADVLYRGKQYEMPAWKLELADCD